MTDLLVPNQISQSPKSLSWRQLRFFGPLSKGPLPRGRTTMHENRPAWLDPKSLIFNTRFGSFHSGSGRAEHRN
jgi:hypothetical protein